ncbi:MAG: YfiR family protein [Candidatus Zixiibacteriota bacterium]
MVKRISTMLFVLFLLVAANGRADGDDDNYKADFIIKLFSYVDWPAGKAAGADGAVTVGVVGPASCMAQLKAAADKRTGEGKKTIVKELAIDGDFSGCQVVFFQTQEKPELAKILKKIGGQPILSVGDCPGFAKFGVMVNFYTEADGGKTKVKFEINTVTVGDAQLKISSSLLKLARLI